MLSEQCLQALLEKSFAELGFDRAAVNPAMVRAVRDALGVTESSGASKRKIRRAIEAALKAQGVAEDSKPGKLAHAFYAQVAADRRPPPKASSASRVSRQSVYAGDIGDFRTFRYRHIPLPENVTEPDAIARLFEVMPADTIPFGNHPQFDDFYAKLDIVFKTFLRNFYMAAPGAGLITERIGAARRGVPKKFPRSEIESIVAHGQSFSELWDQKFSRVLGRASTFYSIAESDVFVGSIEGYVTQIRNTLLLSANESRPEELALLECARILRNANHVRLLGPHDRFQDCLVVIAAMNHLFPLAVTLRGWVQAEPSAWEKDLPAQTGYQGDIRVTLGQLVTTMIVRGMDPDIYDTETLTPRALIEEKGYRPDELIDLGRSIWPEGPISALMQMFEDLPDGMHDDVDRLLAETFGIAHATWESHPWLQSPYTSLTIASAAQMFLKVLSVPFSRPLPLAELAFFPLLRSQVVASLIDTQDSHSMRLSAALQPDLESIASETHFGMPADYPREGIVYGPVYRRLTGETFSHMPETYHAALLELARRKSFARLERLLTDIDVPMSEP